MSQFSPHTKIQLVIKLTQTFIMFCPTHYYLTQNKNINNATTHLTLKLICLYVFQCVFVIAVGSLGVTGFFLSSVMLNIKSVFSKAHSKITSHHLTCLSFSFLCFFPLLFLLLISLLPLLLFLNPFPLPVKAQSRVSIQNF